MDWACIVFGVTFVVSGIVFATGKWHTHMPAWQNMPDEEKAKINIIPLCRNIGTVIMIAGAVFLLRAFVPILSGKLFVVCMILWLIGAGCDLAYITKGKRYINNR